MIFVGIHLSIIFRKRLHEFDLLFLTRFVEIDKHLEGATSQLVEQNDISTYILENRILHLYYENINDGFSNNGMDEITFLPQEIYDKTRWDIYKQGSFRFAPYR